MAELAISHVCCATWEAAHNGIGTIDFPTAFLCYSQLVTLGSSIIFLSSKNKALTQQFLKQESVGLYMS